MDLSLRTYGTDDNPAGASLYVSIPVPVGVQDGDIVVVGLAIPSADIEITPPDDTWTKIERSNPAHSLGVVCYWKTALNEAHRWVFALSDSIQAAGAALVYANADSHEPIEAVAIELTGSSTSHGVDPISPSLDGEALALFLAASTSGTYTAATGFQRAAAKTQADATVEAHHRILQFAGARSAFNVTFSTPALGASALIVIRPSAGTVTVDEARERILDGIPRGADRVYDLEPGGDYRNFFQALAIAAKEFVYDPVDETHREAIATRSRYKLPDWERALGRELSRTARTGTVPQRQAQVKAFFRSAAGQGSSGSEIASVLGPLLGYFPTTPVEIIECEKPALDMRHSYGYGADLTVSAGNSGELLIFVPDGGLVSQAGVRLTLEFDDADLADIDVRLTSPGRTSVEWLDGWSHSPLVLRSQAFAGVAIHGVWTLRITNNGGTSRTLIASAEQMLIDGIGRGQDTGGAIFHWAVYADPDHLGENGTAPDFEAADEALARMAFVHGVGRVIYSVEPWPGVMGGAHAAIPGRCIPSRAV